MSFSSFQKDEFDEAIAFAEHSQLIEPGIMPDLSAPSMPGDEFDEAIAFAEHSQLIEPGIMPDLSAPSMPGDEFDEAIASIGAEPQESLATASQQPIPETEHGFLGEITAGLGRGALRVAATPAYLADVAGEAIGWEGLEEVGEQGAEKVEKYIEESPGLRKSASISGDIRKNPQLWKDPNWYASIVSEGIPTVFSMMIPGLGAAKGAQALGWAAKGVKAARVAGGLGAAMGLEAGGAAEQTRQYEKATGKEIPIGKKLQAVIGTGIVAGALEYVPIFKIFGKSAGKKLISRVLEAMALEGSTEGAQEIVANAFAKAGYDADQDMMQGIIESVVGGVLIGGGMGGISGPAKTFQDQIKDSTTPENIENISHVIEEGERETVLDKLRKASAEDLVALRQSPEGAEYAKELDQVLGEKRVGEECGLIPREEAGSKALPPDQGFGLVPPKPKTKLRPGPEKIEGPTYPEGAEFVAGKAAPEELKVEHKPVLTTKEKPYKEKRNAIRALNSKRLASKGITPETHKVVKVKGGYGIVPLVDWQVIKGGKGVEVMARGETKEEKLKAVSEKVKAETPGMLKESDRVNDVTLRTLVDMASKDPAKALKHAEEATVSKAKLIEGLKNKGLKAIGEAKSKAERAEIAKNLEEILRGIEEEKPKEVTQIDLVKRYVKETGKKVEEGELDKVKAKYPEEWARIEKAEIYKKELWNKLPKDFRRNRGINEYTTEELEKKVTEIEPKEPIAKAEEKQPWEMSLDEFKTINPKGFKVQPLPREDIARAEPDGTISLDPEKFFGHSAKDRKDIIEHERAHFIEGKIKPEHKARLMDDKEVMAYRGRNINEKLANMIQDNKLPDHVRAEYPELLKPKEPIAKIEEKQPWDIKKNERRWIVDSKTGNTITEAVGRPDKVDIDIPFDEKIIDIHTHPTEAMPSDYDWGRLGWSNVTEMRVVVPSGTVYEFKKPSGFKKTPRQLRERHNAIENEIFESGRSKKMSINAILEEINKQLAKETGIIFKIKSLKEYKNEKWASDIKLKESNEGKEVSVAIPEKKIESGMHKILNTENKVVGSITLSREGNVVNIDDIEILEKGKGTGTKTIKDLMKSADKQGLIITLTSDAMRGKESQKLNRLWYKKLGFTKNIGKDKIKETSEEFYYNPEPAPKEPVAKAEVIPKVKEPWEISDLADRPNLSINRITAKKQANRKFKLFFTGTRNEVFEGEEFNSASEARMFFKAQQVKAQEAFKAKAKPEVILREKEKRGLFGEKARPVLKESEAKYSIAEAEPFMYSALTHVAESPKFPAKLSAKSVINQLKKQPGVKQAEINTVGLTEWLEGKDRVTKAELVDFLKMNEIRIEEKEMGGILPSNEYYVEHNLTDKYNLWSIFGNNISGEVGTIGIGDSKEEAINDAKEYLEDMFFYNVRPSGRPKSIEKVLEPIKFIESKEKVRKAKKKFAGKPKFAEYVLPGGEPGSYRELVFTVPVKYQDYYLETEWKVKKDIKENLDGSETDIWGIFRKDKEEGKEGKWRVVEWYDTEADAVKNKPKDSKVKLNKQTNKYVSAHWDEPNVIAHIRGDTHIDADGKKTFHIAEFQSDIYGKIVELEEIIADAGGITDNKIKKELAKLKKLFPWGENWHELVSKKALEYVVRNDFDGISWDTAKTQVDRWESALRKSVDEIGWEKGYSGPKRFSSEFVDIKGFKDGKRIFNQRVLVQDETTIEGQRVTLNNLIGKELANKIRESSETSGNFEGKNLTIGGEFYKIIYDQKIPGFLKKYGKKWGTTVKADKVGDVPVHTMAITPTMRRAIEAQGQAIMEPMGKYKQSELDLAFGGKKKANEAIESVAKKVDGVSSRRMPDRVAGKVSVSKVAKEIRKNKRVDLSGRKLTEGNESQEIAELFQVYRSPKMETLHAIYTARDGTILGHNAITSGQIGVIDPGDSAKYIYGIQSSAKRLGANKVHVLHNHPSGNPTMSNEDVEFARGIRKKLGDLSGEFIVIDHGKFTWVSDYIKDGSVHVLEGTFKVIPGTGEWVDRRGPVLSSPQASAVFGAKLAYDKTKTCLVYVDNANKVVGWSTHDNKILKKSVPDFEKILRQQAKSLDAIKTVIIADDMTLFEPIAKYGDVGDWLLDALDVEGKSLREAVPNAFETKRKPTKKARGLFEPKAEYGKEHQTLTPSAQKLLGELEELKKEHRPSPLPPDQVESPAGKAVEPYNDLAANLRTRTVDRLYPLMKKLDQGLDIQDPDAQAYIQGRMDTSAPTVVATFLQHGKLKWLENAPLVETKNKGFLPLTEKHGTNEKKVDSYDASIQALLKDKIGYKPKSIRDIDRYLFWKIATRAEKLTGEDREHLFTEDDIALLKKIGGKDWKGTDLDNEYVAFNKNVLDFAQEIGLIDPAMRKVWEHDEYIPFYRILEDELLGEEFLRVPFKSRKFIDAQIKKLTGGEDKLGDPFENILRNWSHLITESIRNRSRTTSFRYMQKLGYATPSKPPKYIGKPEKEAILSYMENGKRKYFKVHDLELFNALSGANIQKFDGILMKMFGTSKRMLTYGATFGPAFRVANFMRDTLQTAMVNKSFIPVWDSMQGLYKAYTESPEAIAMMSAGGGFSLGYVRGDDPKAMARHVRKIVRKAHKKGFTLSPLSLLEWWEKVGSASENAARVQLYANWRKKGASNLVAGYQARDVLDFSLAGDAQITQLMIRTIPFLGARMQGLYKMGRAYGENPGAFLLKGAILAGLSLAWWSGVKDDDRYKELENWEKWTYRHFWIGDTHFRLPRAFEVDAIFSSSVESIADVLSGNEEGKYIMHFIGQTMRDTFALDVPQLVKPLYEQAKNKIRFTGRPIISESMKRVKSGEQAQPWTSESLRVLGEKLNVSPMRAETLVRGYLGTLGMFILGGTDILAQWAFDFPTPPKRRVDDYPLIGRFVRETPPRHTKYMTRFYKMAREMDVLVGTINHYKKTGDIEKAVELARTSRNTLQYKKGMNKIRRKIGLINGRIKIIYYRKDLTPEQKKERVNKLLDYRNKILENAYTVMTKKE